LAIWTTAAAHAVTIPVTTSANSLATTNMMGEQGSALVQDGRISARLTGSPMYIDLGTATVDK
jgi:hypothetical protein